MKLNESPRERKQTTSKIAAAKPDIHVPQLVGMIAERFQRMAYVFEDGSSMNLLQITDSSGHNACTLR